MTATSTIDDARREAIRRSRDEIEAALRANGVELHGKECKCPFHEDGRPSAGIFQDRDGTWLFKCMSAKCGWTGDVFSLRAALENKPLKDLLPMLDAPTGAGNRVAAAWPPEGETVRATPTYRALADLRAAAVANRAGPAFALEAEYTYADPATKAPDLVVFRLRDAEGKKTFRQARPAPGGFQFKKPDGPLPLYNRTRLADPARDCALVVEGEKCVQAVTPHLPYSFAATTAPQGAGKGKAAEADWSPLAGKTVYLWPDADPPDAKGGRVGIDHMRAVADLLGKLAPPPKAVYWIDPDTLGLPPKGDCADFIAALAGRPAAEVALAVEKVLGRAAPLCPSESLLRHIRDVASGRLAAARLPWDGLHRLTQCLKPGTVTVLCGAGGASKSYWSMEACYCLTRDGFPAEYLALEREKDFHLKRLLTVLEGTPRILDDEWVAKNPADAEAMWHAHRPQLDLMAPRINAEPTAAFTRKQALEWVKAACARKARVICIDPVTALAGDGDIWTEDLAFLMSCREAISAAGASLLCVTHPKKSNANKAATATDDVAGGACWARFCDTLLWLRRPRPDGEWERATVRRLGGLTPGLKITDTYNRVFQLAKTRDGSGDGAEIAFKFGGGTMRFSEAGLVVKDSAAARGGPPAGGGRGDDD